MLTRDIIKQEEHFGAAHEKFKKDQKSLAASKNSKVNKSTNPKLAKGNPKALRAHHDD
jgi:hypothetical protein